MVNIRQRPVPLFLPLLAVIFGILLGFIFKKTGLLAFFYSGSVIAAASLLTGLTLKKWYLAGYTFIISLIFLSSANYIYNITPVPDNISYRLPFEGRVYGKVALSKRHFILKVTESASSDKNKFSGKVLVHWKEKLPPPGARVEVSGKFYRPRLPLNPGLFNWRKYLENMGIFTEARAASVEIIWKGTVANTIGWLREYVEQKIDGYLPANEAGILSGMLLGNPGAVSAEARESFRQAGIIHILAVSGLHVGLILYVFYYIFSALGIKRKNSLLISLIFMIIYVIVTGARPSAVRAAIMVGMMVMGNILGGRGNVYNSLCFAGILILSLKPGLLFTAGFLLSFLAVSGIVYLAPALYKYLGKPLAVSVSAMLPIMPVLASSFYYLPLIAPVTNIIVVPLAGIIISLGLFFVTVAGFSSFLANIYSVSLSYIIKILEYITEIIKNFGIGGINWGRPNIFIITGFYMVLILMGLKVSRKRNLAFAAALLIVCGGIVKERYYGKRFVAAIKSSSSCVFVIKESPDNVLVFVGKEDVNGESLKAFLYSKGIRKIRHIYLIHPLYENMVKTAELANEFKTEKIFYPGIYGNESRWYEFKDRLGDIGLYPVKKGDKIDYGSFQVNITEPHKRYLDIRDNYIQAEITGKDTIFIYGGGSIPDKVYDTIIAVEPYRPEWDIIKKRYTKNVIFSGKELPPQYVDWIKEKGKVFYF